LQPKIELSPEEKQLARQQFEKLTEAASSLMDSGELDLYSQKKVIALPYSKSPAYSNNCKKRRVSVINPHI